MAENNKPADQLFGMFSGHVVEVKKHRFLILFRGPDGNTYGLELKKKKLNEVQAALLKVDLPVMVDFSSKKVMFVGENNKLY